MSAPVIEAERLRLVPFGEEHLTERYVGWLNDPEVVRYSDQRFRTHTLESCRRYRESFEGTPHYLWAIVARDPELGHIGNLSAYLEVAHGLADVGILVGERAVWGRGYGSEAWNAACAFLLGDAGVRKVTAGTLATNVGMLAVMRRAGMVEDGRRRAHHLVDGEPVDMVYAALFRDRPPASGGPDSP